MTRKALIIFSVLLSTVISPTPEIQESIEIIEPIMPEEIVIVDKPTAKMLISGTTTPDDEPATKATKRELALIGNFEATAYDLSVESCGKNLSHPAYGITASGFDITGKNIQDRLIAADTTILPFDSVVYIEFPEETRFMEFDGQKIDLNGIYTVVDRGEAIKGNRIDIFFGEDKPGEKKYNQMCFEFGRQRVKVFRIE